MSDVNCPYCGRGQEIRTDDGYGMAEDQIYEQDCGDCGKVFAFTTSILVTHEAHAAPCLNGEPHRWGPVSHAPYRWPDWKACRDCGEEKRGKMVSLPGGEG